MKRTILRPDQERELDDFFNGGLEAAAGAKSSLGPQLDHLRDGTAGCQYGAKPDVLIQRGYLAVATNRKMVVILGGVGPKTFAVLRAMYHRGATAALRELVPFFGGDFRVAQIAVDRVTLPAPGASGVRILSQLCHKASGADKDAKKAIATMRDGIQRDIAGAERELVRHYKLWTAENVERKRKQRERSRALLRETLEAERKRPHWWTEEMGR